MSKKIPETQYDRLLYALGLEQTEEYYRTFFTEVSNRLGIRMSLVSDCKKRGNVVTEVVLEAAKAKGINPDFITTGALPVHLTPDD